jgi:hypothetical protein
VALEELQQLLGRQRRLPGAARVHDRDLALELAAELVVVERDRDAARLPDPLARGRHHDRVAARLDEPQVGALRDEQHGRIRLLHQSAHDRRGLCSCGTHRIFLPVEH